MFCDIDALAIHVSGVSKRYQIYATPRDRLKQFVLPRLCAIWGATDRRYFREFWALRALDVSIKKGETVGIVGRNGSGKSTLLQIICGTLTPTTGEVSTVGRVAALLELGSGFNPEFTGRENVYLNGALLGMSLREIEGKFQEILDFSEIAEFVDQPVKTYSSGMVVRLAFSVAINSSPDILVIDEALSVGDEVFQRKCFSRIEKIKKGGATILFVSHSGSAIIELCDRAILIDSGEKVAEGDPKFIIGQYHRMVYAPAAKALDIRAQLKSDAGRNSASNANAGNVGLSEDFFDENLLSKSQIKYESQGALIECVGLWNGNGHQVNCISSGSRYAYQFDVIFARDCFNVMFGMMLKTPSGFELGGALSSDAENLGIAVVKAGDRIRVSFEFVCKLNSGIYFLNAGVLGLVNGEERYLHRIVDALTVRVHPDDARAKSGPVDLSASHKIEFVRGGVA